MLKISPAAFDQFASAQEQQFMAHVADYLTHNVSGLGSVRSTDHLATTRQAIARARSHGFRSEQDIVRFSLCCALLGLDFAETLPGAREIIQSRDSAERRARLLEYFARELFDVLER